MEGRQQAIETGILLILYEESELTARRLKPNQIAAKFTSPVGEVRVVAGLKHLQKKRLISGSFDNFRASGFAITREGILYVEDRFEKEDQGPDTAWREKLPANDEAASKNHSVLSESPRQRGEPKAVEQPSGGVTIVNNFSPTNSISSPPPSPDQYGRSAARAGWLNVWVALAIGIAAILVTLWIAGKL